MTKPNFVYVTYIASTPEKVFKALTDTDATAQFWFGNAVTSDWKIGSSVTFRRNGELVVSGKVLECDPPRRLSYTFHSQHDGLYTEQPSRVVFDLEQQRAERAIEPLGIAQAGGKLFQPVANAILDQRQALVMHASADRQAPPAGGAAEEGDEASDHPSSPGLP
jgi:activator of Hsp90 ATPase-like protein